MRVRGYAAGTPCWVDVSSPDPVATQRFYGTLFGWSTAESSARRTPFRLGDLAVAGMRRNEPAQWLTYFATDDLATTAKAVAAAGGAVLQGPTVVGVEGQAALFADPAGAAFAGWERGAFCGAQVTNEPNAVCWHELATPDIEGARAFYGQVFGWAEGPGEWQTEHGSVAGIVTMDNQHVRAMWTVCFMVSDCAAAAARAVELGGRVVAGPRDEPGGRVAQLADQCGARFTVIELPPEIAATLR